MNDKFYLYASLYSENRWYVAHTAWPARNETTVLILKVAETVSWKSTEEILWMMHHEKPLYYS